MRAGPPNEARSRGTIDRPDPTGRYYPSVQLDPFWRILAENAPVRWLYGVSLVNHHLLDLYFDPELARHLRNQETAAPVIAHSFYFATAPFRAPTHPAYVVYIQLIANLFQRYPAFAVLYQQASQGSAAAGSPDAERVELAGPAGLPLAFTVASEATDPEAAEGVAWRRSLVPADRATDAALVLLHLVHGAATPEDLGTTGDQQRGWLDAALTTIAQRLAARPSPTPWDPLQAFREQWAARRDQGAVVPGWAELRAQLAEQSPEIQRAVRASLAALTDVAPQLVRELEITVAPAARGVAALWRPGEPFPIATAIAALGQPTEVIAAHPVYGSGYKWEFGRRPAGVTVIRLFPERRYVMVERAAPQPSVPAVELVLDVVSIGQDDSLGAMQLLSLWNGWGILATVYTNGEVDVISRLAPAGADALAVWRAMATAEAVPPSTPASTGPAPVPVTAAARQLGYHPTYIKTLINTGRLVGYKLGRNWFVDPTSLAAFQDQHGARGAVR